MRLVKDGSGNMRSSHGTPCDRRTYAQRSSRALGEGHKEPVLFAVPCSFALLQPDTSAGVFLRLLSSHVSGHPPLTADDETQARMFQNSHSGSHPSPVDFH